MVIKYQLAMTDLISNA